MKTISLKLLLALTLAVHATAAHATLFTTNTTIDAGIPTYDGQDIVVSNCTLTVNGAHSFASLLLTSNALLTHASAANGETDNRLDLTIAGDATVDPTSAINTTGLGYGANLGPGCGGQSSWGGPGGGGHGGHGGDGIPGAGGGAIYGSITTPITCGSGGNNHGGAGGGVIRLAVGGMLVVDGVISASGNDAYWTDGGGGAGGSIFLSAATLAGTGSIRADGGAGGSPSGDGGGGGGRLALLADTLSFSGSLAAAGGPGFQAGGAGTSFTRVAAEPFGRVRLDNAGRVGFTRFDSTNWPVGEVFALSLAGAAKLVPLIPLTVSQLEITNAAMLTHDRLGQPLRVNVLGSALIGAGASINADGAGYFGSNRGPGAGGWSGWYAGGGGGYGGQGGAGIPGGGQGATYGSYLEPLDFGSAGLGGVSYGGGSIRLAVGGTLTVNGSISANGVLNNGAGGASGGSIYLAAGTVVGNGVIQADGSGAGASDSGGGGGGRIAVCTGTMSFLGTQSVAGGPGGFASGGVGTIYLTNTAALCGSVRSATQQGLAGARISATGGSATSTDAQGGFLLLVPPHWSGSVSATATNQLLTPASRALTDVTTPQFGLDFTAESLRQPVLSFQNLSGILRLSWDSQSGPNYQIYSTPDFINWSVYAPLQPGTGNAATLDCPMTNSPGLFFRVQATGD